MYFAAAAAASLLPVPYVVCKLSGSDRDDRFFRVFVSSLQAFKLRDRFVFGAGGVGWVGGVGERMESYSDWSFAGGMKGNPELFSRYDVLERIGEGTFGEVYKGRRKVDGLIVAMKETRDPQCSSRELEALMVLAHPNVVKLIEYFVQGPNLVLVLEYLPTDLAQVIQESERPLRESEIKGWMLQILAGVAACHRASILHRDLKPSNMLVGADGSLKVADFGQARTVYEEGSNWPSDPCMVGAFDCTAGGCIQAQPNSNLVLIASLQVIPDSNLNSVFQTSVWTRESRQKYKFVK